MADELYRSYSLEKSKNDDGEIITSGSMTIWEDTPDFPLSIGEHFRPVSSSPLLTVDKLSVKDNVVGTLNGKPVRQWQITIEGKNGEESGSQTENNVKYTFIIADNKKSGTMEVVNTGESPSLRLEVGDTFSVPGIGNVKCTKITGNDEYTDSGTRKWITVYEWTDGNGESDTKYNFSIERSGDNTISTGSKTVTNSGNSPSNVALAETITVPGVGALPCVKVSGSDDYDENGNHIWTVTHEGSNAPNATQETHDTKYNFSIERNGDNDTIITGSKTVTNSGSSPSSATLPTNVNLPGIGNIKCVKVSGSDDYDDDGSHIWTVTYDGSNAPVTTQTEHDTKYNFSIENSNNEVVKTGSKTVIISGNTLPNLSVGETINVPGIGNVKCVKVSGNDDYDDDGTRKWTVVYDCTDAPQEQTTSSNIRYSINIEKNSDGVVVYTGTKEITSDSEPTTSTNIGDKLTFPLIGSVPCVRIYSNNNDNGTWTLVIECSSEGESGSGSGEGGGEGGTSTSLPETEVETTYEINGTTARSVAGELIILKRSDTSITKQTVTVYTQDGNSVANPGSSYRGGICISEHISKETIKNNGVVVSSYFKHVIEVEA